MKIFRYLEESDVFRGRRLSENKGFPKGCAISKVAISVKHISVFCTKKSQSTNMAPINHTYNKVSSTSIKTHTHIGMSDSTLKALGREKLCLSYVFIF